jgi:predicted RNA binding protein YcfA (HicA-like mRNA interferase family)
MTTHSTPILLQSRVTVAGKPSDELPPETLNSIVKQAGWKK